MKSSHDQIYDDSTIISKAQNKLKQSLTKKPIRSLKKGFALINLDQLSMQGSNKD